MSDNFLSLIPEQTDYVPSTEAQSRAVAILRALAPGSTQIEARVFEQMTFVDLLLRLRQGAPQRQAGARFERSAAGRVCAEMQLRHR
jgi:hypothetical protein